MTPRRGWPRGARDMTRDDDEPRPPAGRAAREGDDHHECSAASRAAQASSADSSRRLRRARLDRGGPVPLRLLLVAALAALDLADLARELDLDGPPDPPEPRPAWRPEAAADAA